MIPIVPAVPPYVPRPSLEARLERTLADVRGERPDLALDEEFRACVPLSLQRVPTLHLDDSSTLRHTVGSEEWSLLQDRARLRAQTGDFVGASHPPPAGYEAYCQEYLGLGTVAWLQPRQARACARLASHCWIDRDVRTELVRLLRADLLSAVHPFMGSREVWQLARLLRHASRRPVFVVAPPPALTAWVNDKIEFSRLIQRLFGDRWLPPTRVCSSLSALSRQLRDLADRYRVLAIKVADGAGGHGNVVVSAERIRGRSLGAIHAELRRRLRKTGWHGERHLLVGAWETDVLSTPSAQLWLPLPPDPPMVEALFEQIIEGPEGEFAGGRPADLPAWVVEELTERTWIVGRLLQRLGYVGRCSFDFVLVGGQLDRARLEFVECNGRWGGTSLPMTLVNRLLPVTAPRRYVIRSVRLPGPQPWSWPDLLEQLEDLLFDVRTGRGRLVLFNPLRAERRRDLHVVAFGDSLRDAGEFVDRDLRERLLAARPARAVASSPMPADQSA